MFDDDFSAVTKGNDESQKENAFNHQWDNYEKAI